MGYLKFNGGDRKFPIPIYCSLLPVIFISNLRQRALKPESVCVSFKPEFHMNSGDYVNHLVLGVITDGK